MSAISKIQVARQFSRAAASYDKASEAQQQLADVLLGWFDQSIGEHACTMGAKLRATDLGCGTGNLLAQLRKKLPRSKLTGVDIAPGMLAMGAQLVADTDWLKEDMEHTSLADASQDYVFSSAALQWTDCANVLREVDRMLKPGGTALIGLFVAGTLPEWRRALAQMQYATLIDLPEPVPLIEAARKHFQLRMQQQITCEVRYSSLEDMVRSTKRTGATNARTDRQAGLMGTQRWGQFLAHMEQQSQGDYCCTYKGLCLWLEKPAHV